MTPSPIPLHRRLGTLWSRSDEEDNAIEASDVAEVRGAVPWYSDDADSRHATRLGRKDFLERVWDIIDEARIQETSTVFGLVGPWGSGKSSMLKWLSERAKTAGETPWTIIDFNPWDFPDSDSLQLGFFATLGTHFENQKWEKAGMLLRGLGLAVAPLTAVGPAFGLFDASKVVDGVAKLFGGDRSATAVRKKLTRTLKEQKHPVLIVIDDLDRVSSDELLITLKLIRQLGRLPYVHYLLSYDETTILDVLTQTNLIGEKRRSRARDYLEKVVQVRFDIPRLRPDDRRQLANEAFHDLQKDTGLRLSGDQNDRYSSAYTGFIASRLSTPRALRRYFVQVRLLAPQFADEVDLADFLILTWLRTFESGAYALIQERRADIVGSVSDRPIRNAEDRSVAQSNARERWAHELVAEGTREEDVPLVLAALAALFPRFADSVDLPSDRPVVGAPSIAHAEYFDRYFSAGIPDNDIPDAVISKAVADVEAGERDTSEAVAHCMASMSAPNNHVIGKLIRASTAARIREPAMFAWLSDIYSSQSSRKLNHRSDIRNLIEGRLRELNETAVAAACSAIARTGGEYLLFEVVFIASQSSHKESRLLVVTEELRNILSSAVDTYLARQEATIIAMPELVRALMDRWKDIDEKGFSNWLHDQAAAYGEIEALGYFTARNPSGINGSLELSGFDAFDASQIFDLSDIARRHQIDVEDAPLKAVSRYDGVKDTPQNRRTIVLNALKTLLSDGSPSETTARASEYDAEDEPQEHEGEGD